ncbi:L-ascorbate oxidase [Hordeum vulgare]|nr:L-ascorbate oxidase [Hordeum vulgare]
MKSLAKHIFQEYDMNKLGRGIDGRGSHGWGFGPISFVSRLLIPVPFDPPADDLQVVIGDWYTKAHAVMASLLNAGRSFGRPADVLINDRGNKEATNPHMFTWEAAKTYRLRICNVGIKSSLNFRIHGHNMH